MLKLRFPWLWMGLGWMLVLAICVGSLLPVYSGVSISLNDKLIHFTSYFLLTVWFSGLYSRARYYVLIAAIVIVLGVLLDVMQGATATRHFDLFDILANAAGAVVGFVLSIALIGGWCSRVERWIAR